MNTSPPILFRTLEDHHLSYPTEDHHLPLDLNKQLDPETLEILASSYQADRALRPLVQELNGPFVHIEPKPAACDLSSRIVYNECVACEALYDPLLSSETMCGCCLSIYFKDMPNQPVIDWEWDDWFSDETFD